MAPDLGICDPVVGPDEFQSFALMEGARWAAAPGATCRGKSGHASARLGDWAGLKTLGLGMAEPGLVLEPDFDPPVLGQMAYVRGERAGEVFLNPSSTR